MGVAVPLVALVSVAVARVAVAAAPAPGSAAAGALDEKRGPVSVDWGEGTLTARAGAAADLRMPSADLARPGAERRARATAVARLKDALTTLPLGDGRTLAPDAIDRALARVVTVDVQYQSNGGAVVQLRVRFGDWLAQPAASGPALALAEARLAAAPALRIGGKDVVSGAARYRIGAAPSGSHAIAVKSDADGHWVVAKARRDKGDHPDPDLAEKLAGAAIVIYVQKVLR